MNITIHGLAAFSYTWNKERDSQGSMIKAFARAVVAIAVGVKVNADNVRSMQQDHPTSIFARCISKKTGLSNLLHTDNTGQQQSAFSTVRDHSDINATGSSRLTDMSVRPAASTADVVASCTNEINADCPTDEEVEVMGDQGGQREITSATATITHSSIDVDPVSAFARPINKDDFSFLSDFVCKDAAEEELTGKNAFLDNWFSTYSDTFVAHASPTVAEACQSMLVEDQKLLSAEALCRKGFVNYESTTQYERKNLKYDVEKIKDLILQENIPLYDIEIQPREEVKHLFRWTFSKDGVELSFQERIAFLDRVKEIADIHHIPESLILLILDEMRGKEGGINAMIYAAYSKLQKQIQNPEQLKNAFENLLSIKKNILAFHFKTTCELRFSPGSVSWGYGDLVVLKGKLPQSVVTGQGMLLNEVYGLQSLENGGNLYNVGLHEEDVLILAPRFKNGHSLVGLRSTMGYKNMFFYDELPAKYLDKLGVPAHLRVATTTG